MNLVQNPKSKVQSLFLILFFLSSLFSLLSTYDAEAAEPVSLNELLENAPKYDGKVVTFEGEVIGDIMIRQEAAWINVLDKTGAIGVFCPKGLTGAIKYTGSYKFTGDTVLVSGTFHRACPEHGGDTDIHAREIVVIQKGREIAHSVEQQKVKLSIILLALVFLLTVAHLGLRRLRAS